MREMVNADMLSKIQRISTETILQERRTDVELRPTANNLQLIEPADTGYISTTLTEMRRELAALTEKNRVTDLKLEDYKDELLDRLSLAGSLVSRETAPSLFGGPSASLPPPAIADS